MKILKAAALAIALSCLLPTAEAIPTIYSYTGNPYIGINPSLPAGVTNSSGFFEVSAALGANFTGSFVPTRFEFSNGADSVSDGMTFRVATFNATTDASGSLTAWHILLSLFAFNVGDFTGVSSLNDADITPLIVDGTGYCAEANTTGFCSGAPGADAAANQAAVFDDPGTWTITRLPEPGTLGLLGFGLLGAALVRRRKLA